MKHRICFNRIRFNRRSNCIGLLAIALGLALLPRVALANFHIMEVAQIIGGVAGDTTAQAVHLRMRQGGQQFVAGQAQLVVTDAAGGNRIILSTFPGANPLGGACLDILLATPNMAALTSPKITGAYTMAQIPGSYLAAGSLIFEGVVGPTPYWRVSWGGAAYTGPGNVALGVNDADGQTLPAFAGPLPSGGTQSLRFVPACNTPSINTAADYAVSVGNAVLRNNAGTNFTVLLPIPALPDAAKWALPAVLALALVAFAVLRRRAA